MFSEEIILMDKEFIFGNFIPSVLVVQIVILLLALFNIQKRLQAIIKQDIFNFTSSKWFDRSGYRLMLLSVSEIIIRLLGIYHSPNDQILQDIIRYLLILAIGIVLIAFSDVIKKGNTIESE